MSEKRSRSKAPGAELGPDHMDTTSDRQAMELWHPGLLGGGRGLCRKTVTVDFKYRSLPLELAWKALSIFVSPSWAQSEDTCWNDLKNYLLID